MRLLQAPTLTFVDKPENEAPSYAIMSHMWGSDNDEVSFSDMQYFSAGGGAEDQVISAKSGFAKIRNCASIAQSQGLDFIWVDTCCIDKRSSAEISEAIISMFRWYQNAKVCYAFLSDVDAQIEDKKDDDSNNLKQAVQSSRWFKRGWTLQELIAPSKVQFYSQNWSLIGTKDVETEFQSLISEITGIPTDLLDGSRSLESFSIAARMKWASCRQTKRDEDIAYSLMGIFDIHMPILYGEGARAFIRLQEEILKVNNDHSLFAWEATTECTEPTGLLAPSPSCFQNSGNFSPLPLNSINSAPPSAITNIGLQTYLKLMPTSIPGEFHAILDCKPYTNRFRHRKAAIRLTSVGGFQYMRGMSHRIFDIPGRLVENTTNDGYKLVYVRHRPIHFFPKVELLGMEKAGRLENDIHFFQSSRWPDVAGSSNQLGLVRRDGIIAAYRLYFRAAISNFERHIDILVGLSFGSDDVASWRPWCELVESDLKKPLSAVASMAQTGRLGIFTKKDSVQYSINSRLQISLITSRRYEDHEPVVSLEISRTQELSAQEAESSSKTEPISEPVSSSLVALARDLCSETGSSLLSLSNETLPSSVGNSFMLKYEAILRPLTVKDSLTTNLSNSHNPQIRINRDTDTPSARLELVHIAQHISQYGTGFEVLKPDQQPVDTFEAYFSKLLIKACIENNTSSARELIQSPLSVALVHSWTSKVNINFLNFDPNNVVIGFRPLHWAALFGHSGIIEILLENGADPLLKTPTGLSAVHVAIVMGYVDVADKLLVAASAMEDFRVLTEPKDCESLVHFAASYIRTEAVASILKRLAAVLTLGASEECQFNKPNLMGESPLHRASSMDNIHAVNWIIEWRADLVHVRDNRGMTPLFHAAAVGSIAVVQKLLSAGTRVDVTDELDRVPLDIACQNGHHQLVDLLLSADNAFHERDTMLNSWHFAALSRNPDVLRALKRYTNRGFSTRIEIHGDQKGVGLNALQMASCLGSVECAKVLCEVGFSPKHKTKYILVYRLIGTEMKLQIFNGDMARTVEEWTDAHGHLDLGEAFHHQASTT